MQLIPLKYLTSVPVDENGFYDREFLKKKKRQYDEDFLIMMEKIIDLVTAQYAVSRASFFTGSEGLPEYSDMRKLAVVLACVKTTAGLQEIAQFLDVEGHGYVLTTIKKARNTFPDCLENLLLACGKDDPIAPYEGHYQYRVRRLMEVLGFKILGMEIPRASRSRMEHSSGTRNVQENMDVLPASKARVMARSFCEFFNIQNNLSFLSNEIPLSDLQQTITGYGREYSIEQQSIETWFKDVAPKQFVLS